MPTRTPAEKERLRKREKAKRAVFVVLIALCAAGFILVCYFRANRTGGNGSDVNNTIIPEQSDARIEYVKQIASSGYVADDQAVRLELPESGAQLIVTGADNSLCVQYKREIALSDIAAQPTTLFPRVDRTEPAEAADNTEIAAACNGAVKCFAPLFKDKDNEQLALKLKSAITPIYSGESKKTGFLFGIYSFTLEYDDGSGILSITASPSL